MDIKTLNAKAQRREGAKGFWYKRLFASLWIQALLACVFALSISPARAQTVGYEPYRWGEADLALLMPALTEHHEQDGIIMLTASLPAATTRVEVLPETTLDADFPTALLSRLRELTATNYQYQPITWFGRPGLRGQAEGSTQDGWVVKARGRIGRLPDGRVLIVAVWGDSLIEQERVDEVADSVVFGAESDPLAPAFRLLWDRPAPEVPSSVTAITAAAQRLYAVDIERGVIAHNLADGAEIAAFPFQNPAQPTAVAVDTSGVVYVGDRACRCVRRMLPNGVWLDSIGEFGANAPFDITVDGDTVFATDTTAEGYVLRRLSLTEEQAIPLSFNGAAPPLVASEPGWGVSVLEWLSSLMDGTISGSFSRLDGKYVPVYQEWIAISPEGVRDIALRRHLALAGDEIRFLNDVTGELSSLRPPFQPVGIAFDDEGVLYVAGRAGELAAYSDRLPPEHIGDERLRPGVPVQGVLSEANPVQSWTYEGRAGEVISLQAVDLARVDYTAVGLDMDITLLAPDGTQVAYNDDQRGDELFGIYDAHIPDARLPADGVYTVNVGWRQGEGTYTLGISRPVAFALEGGVMRLDGRLQDVFPTAYYRFEGRAGQTLTFTMRAESGTLDPALTLRAPDGSLFAYNDDAADPELGVDAQIVRAVLPADGLYTLEAGRYEGVGRFSLVVVEN